MLPPTEPPDPSIKDGITEQCRLTVIFQKSPCKSFVALKYQVAIIVLMDALINTFCRNPVTTFRFQSIAAYKSIRSLMV